MSASTEEKRSAIGEEYRAKLRAAILQASQLLNTRELDDTIPAILATIGNALQVDRVLVIENHPESASVSLCYGWQHDDVVPVTSALFSEYPSNSEEIWRWLLPLSQGSHVTVTRHSASGAVADLLRKLDIQSLLIVPIRMGENLWGSVGVDLCKRDHEWNPVEIDLLKILASAIGTTIVRDRYLHLLQASEQKFRTVAEAALDAMIVVDASGTIQYWNPAAERILGYSPEEAAGKTIHDWIAPSRYREAAAAGIQHFRALGGGGIVGKTRECAAIRKDGAEIPIELSVGSMQIEGQWSAVGIVRDISSRKEAEERIVWLARNDVLTGLPNRNEFVGEVQRAITRYGQSGERFAVFYLDLDHFKEVNDSLGHAAGDLLLKQVAERLRSAIRDTDRIARFGGDEFAILATQLVKPADASLLASKLVAAMAEPFWIEGTQLRTGASIGIANCDHDDPDADTLLAHADAALYNAKSDEKGTFRFFTHRLHNDVRQRLDLLSELRRGIDEHELLLLYQPQFEMLAGTILGIEALVRWNHPQRGLLRPAEFINVAENSGLTIRLGRFVLRETCRQLRQWIDRGISVPLVAINVSPMQFRAPMRWSAEVYAALHETGLQPDRLELELTESTLMQVSRENSKSLREMHDRGVRIAIDAFGTGYSCFDYLRRLPVSRLKIAQTFIDEITRNASSAAVTRAAINLGHELNVRLIAEGVETAEQVRLLTNWGCREGQGYYFAEPLTAEAMTSLLESGGEAALWRCALPSTEAIATLTVNPAP